MRRIGIVGFGKIATDQHWPAIRDGGRFELAGIATFGPVPDGVPGRVFADHRAMLEAMPDLEAVAVCTPPTARHGVARDVLQSGRHVLLEKPTAATPSEAEDLRHLAAEVGRTVFATWHSRFGEGVRAAKSLLAGRRVVRMDVQWREDVETWHPGQDWIWRPGGFGVFDPGINALSILTEILPQPLFVQSCRSTVRDGHDMPIAAAIRFSTTHQADLTAAFDWRPSPDIRTIAIETEDGLSLHLSKSGRVLMVDGQEVVSTVNTEYREIYARFDALIQDGQSEADLAPLHLTADAFLCATRA